MSRHLPWWVLALLFVAVPLVELLLIIRLGQVVGPWWTILILLAVGALGSYLVKHQGSRAWRALREALRSHRMPATELADAALILVGGTLLITPGFLTDVVGLFCVLPFTRPFARRLLGRLIGRRLGAAMVTGPGAPSPPNHSGAGRAQPRQTQPRQGPGDVVRGEVVDDG